MLAEEKTPRELVERREKLLKNRRRWRKWDGKMKEGEFRSHI